MFKKRYLWGVVCLLAIFSFAMTGCGGGGGGSDEPPAPPPPPPMCPDGQTGTPPNCVPMPTGPDEVTMAEAMRIAGMIAPTGVTLANTGGTEPSVVSLSTPTADNRSEPVFSLAGDGTATAFMKSTDMPEEISGWQGGIYTHTVDATATTSEFVHTVTKYNDKADDQAQAYNVFFANAATAAHSASTAVTSVGTDGVLNIDGADIAGNHGLFSGVFGSTAPGTFSFIDGTSAEPNAVTGTFRGVPGMFKCESSCTSSRDSNGNLNGLGGTWTFTPAVVEALAASATDAEKIEALAGTMIAGVVQDPDFMILGYWEVAEMPATGDPMYTMRPIADGKRPFGALNAASTGGARTGEVEGTASYTGPATGLYTRTTYDSQRQPSGYTAGQFVASATLNASFGGGVAANQWGISGMIEDFMAGGAAIDGDWVVNLNRRMLGTGDTATSQKNIGITVGDTTSDGTGASDYFEGVTHGGDLHSAAGSWSGNFYGDPEAAQPTSAVGVFDAHFSNGHVRGAFAVD